MQIMCLNGWGGTLHAPLISYLETVSPDILCLQEVVHTPETGAAWLTYRDGAHVLPQRANFFREVAAALPDHQALFCPAAQGVLWGQQHAIPSQWGLASFVHKSLPIIAQVQGFVHKQFSPHDYGDHPRPRNAHALRVFDYEHNRTICIAHMHGLRDLSGKQDTPQRQAQAVRFMNLISQIAAPDDALVVCGDFNVEPDSETFAILAKIGLTDLVTSQGFTSTRTSHYQKPGKFADYMLVNRHVTVLDFSVIADPEISDHCPLLLRI